MSENSLVELREALAADPALREEFRTLGGDLAARVRWAIARGYALSPEQAGELVDDELSDEDLEQVAGGWDGTDPPPGGEGGGTGGGGG